MPKVWTLNRLITSGTSLVNVAYENTIKRYNLLPKLHYSKLKTCTNRPVNDYDSCRLCEMSGRHTSVADCIQRTYGIRGGTTTESIYSIEKALMLVHSVSDVHLSRLGDIHKFSGRLCAFQEDAGFREI